MDKRCFSYGSSWCVDFECADCPMLDTDEQPEYKVNPPEVSIKCGNCGVYRMVSMGVVEKCLNCEDDEYDINEIDSATHCNK